MSAKTEAVGNALQERLNLRLASSSYPIPVAKSYDTDGQVLLTVTASNSADAVIKIAPVSTSAVNSLGLTQNVYTPHTISIAFDTTAETGTSELVKFFIMMEVARFGMKVDLYEEAKAAAAGNIKAANLVGSYEDVQWGSIFNV
jgi:hypothetical protein